jgi:UDP-3-O-[3-hydroxymyristoyl] N-acetylglucosamine deacetylase
MTMLPAEPNTGILFRRVDEGETGVNIPATWRNVVDTRMCTTLGVEVPGHHGQVTLGTVEHLMAAVAGSHLDNLVIEVDGPEVPVMDGSAAPFVFLIDCAGIAEQNAPRRAIRILKHVSVGNYEAMASLTPSSGFSVSCEIDFEAPAIARQEYFVSLENGAFRSEIARARTFGFAEDVQKLRAAGLALGGSLDNAVVVDGDRVMNEGGLRYDDEFVRHKVLDAVGDLSLAGAAILGHFHGYRSGHSMHNRLLRALFADPEAWRLVPLESARSTGGFAHAGPRKVAASA